MSTAFESGGTYVRVPDLAGFMFDKQKFYRDGLKMIVDDIIEGIIRRRAITGGELPRLEPETIMRKLHDHQLVDKGLLSDEYTYQRLNQWRMDTGKITIKPVTAAIVNKTNYRQTQAAEGVARDMPRNQVGYKLQVTGVKSKNGTKYFRFFGVSKDVEIKILDMAGELIQKALERL